MKAKIGKIFSILFPIALGLFLILWQYNKFSAEQIKIMQGHFKNANYFYISISLFIALLGVASRAYRWKFSIEQLGYRSSFYNNFMAVSAGYFINLGIPRSGELSRALILKKYENIPFDKAFGTIVAERVVDTLIFLLFVITAFIIEFDKLKDFILSKIPIQTLEILFLLGTISGLSGLLVWRYSKLKYVLVLKEKLAGLIEGVLSIVKMKNKWAFILHSLFIWFSYFLMFYVTLFALKETSTIGVDAAIIGFVFGTLAIGFTNGGFGVFPILVAQIFTLYAIPETAGTPFGWLVWTSQTLFTIFIGGLSLVLLPVLNKNN